MTDALLALLPQYGLAALVLTTFLSCLAVPLPASLMMLAGGAFVASGDLPAAGTAVAALGGAVAGDQAGFAAGRGGGALLVARLRRSPRRDRAMLEALGLIRRRGAAAVFLSRWLLSPLGPWVNLAAGASRLGWARFSAASLAGETVWVGLYVGLGAAFSDRLVEVARLLGDATWMLAMAALSGVLLWLLRRRWRRMHPGRDRRRLAPQAVR